MFSTNARLILLEVGVYFGAVLLAVVLPRFCLAWLDHAKRGFEYVAARPSWAVVAVVALVLVVRGALLPWLPPPVPGVHDEFSYLLAADTFASGRVTNPPHPLWHFFESFHIIHRPTYASMFPPAQGLMLAIGKVIGGRPWVGVYLSSALMCGAICWLLQAMVPLQWALMGGLLAALRWGIYSYWIESFWGGAVAALGGALAVGALARILAKRSFWPPVILSVGLIMLANSRPYEGLVFALPVLGLLLLWMLSKRAPRTPVLLKNIVFPLVGVLVVGAAAMGYYFWRVTGNPLHMPYQVNRDTYAVSNPFFWQPPHPASKNQDAILRDSSPTRTKAAFPDWDFWCSWLLETWHKVTSLVFFYFWPAVLPVLIALPLILRNRWTQFALVCGVIMLAGLSLERWPLMPHYHAPIAGLMVLLIIQAMRYWRSVRWHSWPVGRFISAAVPLFCAVMLAFRVVAAIFHVPVPEHGLVPWFTVAPGNMKRARMLHYLDNQPGQHLVIVRYSPGHDMGEEWVYNEADINRAKVIWARDAGELNNAPLFHYFSQRQIWLLEPDQSAPHLIALTSSNATVLQMANKIESTGRHENAEDKWVLSKRGFRLWKISIAWSGRPFLRSDPWRRSIMAATGYNAHTDSDGMRKNSCAYFATSTAEAVRADFSLLDRRPTGVALGLDRLETASFLRSNGTFQYLTGLPSFPDPRTLRRFLLHAPDVFWQQMHRVNDRLLQTFIHLPAHRSRLIFDLDSTVVTVFGKQEDAAVNLGKTSHFRSSATNCFSFPAN